MDLPSTVSPPLSMPDCDHCSCTFTILSVPLRHVTRTGKEKVGLASSTATSVRPTSTNSSELRLGETRVVNSAEASTTICLLVDVHRNSTSAAQSIQCLDCSPACGQLTHWAAAYLFSWPFEGALLAILVTNFIRLLSLSF